MANPNIAELGKPYQFQPGNKAAVGRRVPLVARLAERIAAEKEREEKIVELWLNDAGDEADPQTRRNARNDMLDRLIGKPTQGVVADIHIEDDSGIEGMSF